MSTDALAALTANVAPTAIMPPQPSVVSTGALSPESVNAPTGFSDLVTQGLGQINQQLVGAQTDLQQLSVGNVQNLHQIMMRLEDARLSFQLVMQVRNRLLEAYQDVMKMQL